MAFKAVWLLKRNPAMTHEEYCLAHASHAPTLVPHIGHLITRYDLAFNDPEEGEEGERVWDGASIMTVPDRAAFEEIGKILSKPELADEIGPSKEDFIDGNSVISFFATEIAEYDVSPFHTAASAGLQDDGQPYKAVWFASGLPGMTDEQFREAFDNHVKLVLKHLGSTVAEYRLTFPHRQVGSDRQETPLEFGCITEMVWPSRKAYDECGKIASSPDIGPLIQADEKSFINLGNVIALTGRCVKIV